MLPTTPALNHISDYANYQYIQNLYCMEISYLTRARLILILSNKKEISLIQLRTRIHY